MNIFESLENLNVSEECFDEIMGIVEDIFSQIKKVHGEPKYDDNEKEYVSQLPKALNKSAKLIRQAQYNQNRERNEAVGNAAVKDVKIPKDREGHELFWSDGKNVSKFLKAREKRIEQMKQNRGPIK